LDRIGLMDDELVIRRALSMIDGWDVEGVEPGKREKLERFLREVILWSTRIHLIGKARIERTIHDLVTDSLLLLKFLEEVCAQGRGVIESGVRLDYSNVSLEEEGGVLIRVGDIGSGSGFPALVWRILRTDLDVTLFERKKNPRLFLERTVNVLGMKNVKVVGKDAREHRGESFDIVVSKASGRLDALLPLVRKLLKSGGAYATVKGRSWGEELSSADEVGMQLVASRDLPGERGAMLIFRKRGMD
jgi:16S rRNA (guanine(527)-N(7))-methyltransferase RsmG